MCESAHYLFDHELHLASWHNVRNDVLLRRCWKAHHDGRLLSIITIWCYDELRIRCELELDERHAVEQHEHLVRLQHEQRGELHRVSDTWNQYSWSLRECSISSEPSCPSPPQR